MKKAIAILLSTLLLVSLFSVAASASDSNITIIVKSNINAESTVKYNTDKDSAFTLTYNLLSEYPIMNTQGWLTYDSEFLKLESFEMKNLNNTIINTAQVNRVDFNSTEVSAMADFSKGGNLIIAKFQLVKPEADDVHTTVDLYFDEINASNNNKDVPLVSDGKIAGQEFVTEVILSEPYSEPDKPVVKPTEPKKQSSTKKATATKNKNTLQVKAVTKSVKLKKLKKKNQTIKNALKVTKAKGKVSYKIVKKGTTAKIRKFVKISKKGVITFKKWKKAKKGTYKVKVTVTAAGNKTYKKGSKSATVKIKVKK